MNDFRERKRQERVERIAKRAVAAGGLAKLNQATQMVNMDAVHAPGQGAWLAPEPPAQSPSDG